MPITGPCSSGWTTPTGRASRHAILSRRPDAARSDCQHCLSEQGGGLRHPLPGSVRDPANHCRGSEASGGRDPASSPCFTPGGRISCITRICTASSPGGGLAPDGNLALDAPVGRASFCPSGCCPRLFRRLFLTYLQKAFDAGKLRFFASLEPLREHRAFCRHLGSATAGPLGRLHQAALRRTRAGSSSMSDAIHTPGRHFQ